jgi:hypothetical protein
MFARSAHVPCPQDAARIHGYQASVSLNDEEAALLELFGSDCKTAAISTVNLLSAYSAVAYSKGLRLPANLIAFAPPKPHSFAVLPGSGLLSLLAPATRSGLKGFAYYLGKTQDELVRILDIAARQQGIVYDGDVVEAREVTSSAACFAKIALKDLVTIQTRIRREYEVAQMNYLASLLDDVLEGRSPLLADGRLVPVRTEFLIRQRRVELNAEALVAEPHRFEQRVLVTNVSQGGLGFKGASEFSNGQTIAITLVHSTRRFVGKIVWKLGSQAGVEFFEPLDMADPLLNP